MVPRVPCRGDFVTSEADLYLHSGDGAPSIDDQYEHGLRLRHTSDKVVNGIAGHGPCDVCFLLAILDRGRKVTRYDSRALVLIAHMAGVIDQEFSGFGLGAITDEAEEYIRQAGFKVDWGLGPGQERLVPITEESSEDQGPSERGDNG